MTQILVNILVLTSIYALISFSFGLVYRALRFFHLAHALALSLGAYCVYSVWSLCHFPLWFAISIAIVLVVLFILVINKWIYKPMKKSGTPNWQMMIASLGLYVVVQNIVSVVWGDSVLSFRTWDIKVGNAFLGAFISDVEFATVFCSILLLVGGWFFLELTHTGRMIKAVSSDAELSRINGVSTDKAVAWSIILGTFMAACAGILIAADVDMTPTMGFDWLMYGVVAMIIGGMGKMRYLVLGAFLLATAQQLSAYFLDTKWMNATAYVILVIFLYFRPFGFSGKKLKKAEV